MSIFQRRKKDGTLRSPNFYYRFRFEGREYVGSTKTADAKLARQIDRKKHTLAVEGRMLDKVKKRKLPTMKAYSENYLKGYALNKRSRRCDELSLENSILPALGGKRLDQISPADIEAWRNQRLKAKKKRGTGTMAPASVRLEVACLKTILNLAVRDGLIDASPARNVRMPRVNNRRDRVITPGEYRRLLSQLRWKGAHIRPILVLGYETGMRVGEILGLRWGDLQRRKGFAYLADTKNGTSRWVPLNEAAREALRTWPRRNDTDLLFAGPGGKPYRTIRTVWRAICSRARVENAKFHDLRHTFTTRMLEAGVDIRTIMAVTGHKDVAMFARYSHPSDLHLKAAVEGLAGKTDVSNLGTLVPGHPESASK